MVIVDAVFVYRHNESSKHSRFVYPATESPNEQTKENPIVTGLDQSIPHISLFYYFFNTRVLRSSIWFISKPKQQKTKTD